VHQNNLQMSSIATSRSCKGAMHDLHEIPDCPVLYKAQL